MKTKKKPEANYDGFKQCTVCGSKWSTRDRFLEDPDIEMIGYQVNFMELLAGFFLFNHSCRTTLAIPAEEFEDLYDGPIFRERATKTDSCLEHCLHEDDLDPCPVHCECAFVREIIQYIKTWPKRRAA